MRILHTEASPGWGGQEIRILREAEGMRDRGHEVLFAINKEGKLIEPLLKAGFEVYRVPFSKLQLPFTLFRLMGIIGKHRVDVVNTHSSLDSWVGGVASRIMGCRVIRTRHLSTAIRPGLNSLALYNWLADGVVTTCQAAADLIEEQAHIQEKCCLSIPTGIDTRAFEVTSEEVIQFRRSLGIEEGTCLVGTACVLRSWKGVSDFLQAAKILEKKPRLKWLVVGGGVSEKFFRQQWRELGLEDRVIFTGYLENPFTAIASMDIFVLLSTANEGVSQASLQAAFLRRQLITTRVGGLPEVCVHGKSGFLVESFAPQEVADAVLKLSQDANLCREMGENAHERVEEKFTMDRTLDQMENVYRKVLNGG